MINIIFATFWYAAAGWSWWHGQYERALICCCVADINLINYRLNEREEKL